MRYRFTGAVVAMTLAAAVSLTVAPTAQQGRGNPPPPAPAGAQGRGPAARLAQIAGHPNFNGVWQAIGTAHWNLEDHSAAGLSQFWQLIVAIGPRRLCLLIRPVRFQSFGTHQAHGS